MFTSYDPNLPDLDFELVNEKQNDYGTEPLIKDFLSSPALAYRMAQPTNTNKRVGINPLRRPITDESPTKQRASPNLTCTSLTSQPSLLIRDRDTNPTRISNSSNAIRMSSSANTKPFDSAAFLLPQSISPSQMPQAVQSRLENPTRYHLEQMSRKQTLVDDETSIIQQTNVLNQDESSPDSEITSEMDDQLNDDTTCGSIDSNTRGISITPRLSTTLTGEHMSSAFLSSSLSKDGTDSSSRHSSSCPTNILSAKAKIGLPLTNDEMRLVIRDRQKKDNHNMIERRRRFNINDRIKELGTLLPKGTELDSKQNKGTILRASVDYIKILRRQYDNAVLIEEKYQMLAQQNMALQERVKELERKCYSNGIPINSSSATTTTTIRSSPAIAVGNTNAVKQEPSSLSSSLNNNNPLVPPSTPIFATFDSLPPLDSLSSFGIVDEDSNDTNSGVGNNSNDPLSPFTHDPFLSSASFGFDNEMDIGGFT
ncbi:unnamed protein product [Rotaria magnacalcarata]|uniref:BHLH domain-containing protein n=1 Tax=Rotaria magnacalcarata TaxID=392030 RepID=A0A816UKB0_9BILA|nr:unnamed protein product [Rotaria magnacalcarata]CAF2124686.1 unnamed protein product [Rotaria magnacalcarata]CAF3956994.1 unnamed protein product [Rotaria magnacalcarata]CAF4215016.1 unnamed protein product [Rotaria magnacalcarata]